jgi:hypothetical protein
MKMYAQTKTPGPCQTPLCGTRERVRLAGNTAGSPKKALLKIKATGRLEGKFLHDSPGPRQGLEGLRSKPRRRRGRSDSAAPESPVFCHRAKKAPILQRVFIPIFFAIIFVSACTTQSAPPAGQADEEEPALVSLDEAIGDFARYAKGRIPGDSAAAVLDVEAPLKGISDYVGDTLTDNLLNVAGVRMVSRRNIEAVKQEQRVQADGYVDEATAVRMGHLAGWKTVVIGAVRALSTGYRMSLRAVDAESAELLGARSYLIRGDAVLAGIVNPGLPVQALLRREEILAPFNGQGNDFGLTVGAASGKDVFYDGEELSLSLAAAEDCYFVVYQVDVNNAVQLIYPNPYDRDNTLKAGVKRVIPQNARFALHAPFGEERILVFASEQPIDISREQYDPKLLGPEYVSGPQALWQPGGKGLSVRPRGASGQFVYSILPR